MNFPATRMAIANNAIIAPKSNGSQDLTKTTILSHQSFKKLNNIIFSFVRIAYYKSQSQFKHQQSKIYFNTQNRVLLFLFCFVNNQILFVIIRHYTAPFYICDF